MGFFPLNLITSYPENIMNRVIKMLLSTPSGHLHEGEGICTIKCVSFNINNIYLHRRLNRSINNMKRNMHSAKTPSVAHKYQSVGFNVYQHLERHLLLLIHSFMIPLLIK